jgi:GNAT superfamily N-acetyltransferase
LLDVFNREFDTPTTGKAVLATRLRRLLAGGDVIALLTLRPNLWYDGPVAVLDELYVAPEAHGRGLGSALLAAAEAVTRQRGGSCSRSRSTGTTPAPAASTSGTATSTLSRARTSRSSTTTGN